MFSEHHNGGMAKMESLDVDLLESDFSRMGEVKRDLEPYELEEVSKHIASSPHNQCIPLSSNKGQ